MKLSQILRRPKRTREKAAVSAWNVPASVSSWFRGIFESFSGAWQKGATAKPDDVLAFLPVYACVTLIANDIAKLKIRLLEMGSDGIKSPTKSTLFSRVLKRPNAYQKTFKKFVEQWLFSKLIHGNTYVLKVRDKKGVVIQLYVLDPTRVEPLIAPGPTIFYRLSADNLAPEATQDVIVPASEIIHDRINAIYHPLVGVSPLSAAFASARQGIAIQNTATRFFENNAQPGGILTAPNKIGDDTAARLKTMWDDKFGGENQGRVAVLGDGLKFEKMSINPVDAQLIEQWKLSGTQICTAFHVPSFKVGLGEIPKYDNASVLNQIYYSDCLQTLIEDVEGALDEGLGLPDDTFVEFNLDDLIRMDAGSQMEVLTKGTGGGIYAHNEARKKINLPPVFGGESPMIQEQNWSLADLAERRLNPDMNQPKKIAPATIKAAAQRLERMLYEPA